MAPDLKSVMSVFGSMIAKRQEVKNNGKQSVLHFPTPVTVWLLQRPEEEREGDVDSHRALDHWDSRW